MRTLENLLWTAILATLLLPSLSHSETTKQKATLESGDVPVFARKLVKNAPPPLRNGARARCFMSDHRLTESEFCPVIIYRGLTYWPMSFDDNRVAILAAGYDDNKKLVREVYMCGTRYVFYATIDTKVQNVVFWGQAGDNGDATSAKVSWRLLREGGATCPVPSATGLKPAP
ncbi:hypothetical protein [Bordetella sp. H567]|uniref:hypothetical protein n=1 Tax=Bordetella sp. H567 TaxID=1697043 RepID=UPI000832CF4C|nr:hypothetical protein [Bordetella sp. H567]